MLIAKVHPKGQIVIPKDIRERTNLRPGDKVEVRLGENGILLLPLQSRNTATRHFKGTVKGMFSLDDLERIYHEKS
jgi:AbrB family looped-hinge helix DNA binding protein